LQSQDPVLSSAGGIHAFFKQYGGGSKKDIPNAPTNSDLNVFKTTTTMADRLPLPSFAIDKKLTRSELLFSIATQIDARSLLIQGDTEFFLFMDMRAELQWASFNMTSRKWVIATEAYNIRLAELYKKQGIQLATKKNPRALMDKLGQLEPKIANRIATNDFTCESKSHCHHFYISYSFLS